MLEPRSIIQPIRAAMPPNARYSEAEAVRIDAGRGTVSCESIVSPQGVASDLSTFEVPYDLCVVTVGASTNTFGVKGVRARRSIGAVVEQ